MVEQLQTTWKDFVKKGFFGVWRLLNGGKRRYLHGLVRLPGTKPCKLRWFWAVYASKWPQNTVNTSVFSSSYLQEWPQTTLFAGFFVAERAFAVLRGLKVAQSDGTCTGFSTFPPQNPVYWDGFKLCTLQSGHKNTVNTINTSVSRLTPDSLLPFVHPLLSQVPFLQGVFGRSP